MQVFEKDIIVTKSDLDQLQHVNNVRYVQWVQDMAEAHWLSKADSNILETYFWVLIDHHIQYKGEAKLGDTVSARTFVESSEGLISTRIVEMHHKKSNKLIVKSTTKWCLMDMSSKRPTRITESLKLLFA
ncbi:MAG: acyl-CoA thioesterase [Bacteroidota bacterium]